MARRTRDKDQLALPLAGQVSAGLSPSYSDLTAALDRRDLETWADRSDVGPEIRRIIKADIDASGMSRDQYVDRMRALGADRLTVPSLNNMLDDAHAYRYPAEWLAHHVKATESPRALMLLAGLVGYEVVAAEDMVYLEMGRVLQLERDLDAQKKALAKRSKRLLEVRGR